MSANADLRERLDETLAEIEDARKLVGRSIPAAAAEWAEKNGLDVQVSEFAPPGALYIIGAVPVALLSGEMQPPPLEWLESDA